MTEKYVWIIHYYDDCEITVCGSKEAAYKYGKQYLEETLSYDKEHNTNYYEIAMREFEESCKKWDGQFEVEDIFYCDKEKVWD